MGQFFYDLLGKFVVWANKRRSIDLAAMTTLFIIALVIATIAIDSSILYFVWTFVVIVIVFKISYIAFESLKSKGK